MAGNEQLIAEFEQLLLEGLGTCEGQESQMRDMFEAYKDHVRDDAVKDQVQDMVLITKKRPKKATKLPKWFIYVVCPIAIAVILAPLVIPEDISKDIQDVVRSTECIVDSNFFITEMARPIFDCNICKDLKEVPVVEKISRKEFVEKYAYSYVPVLVKHAVVNWTAIDNFSFKFFQRLYREAESRRNPSKKADTDDEEDEDELACQFFPYGTEFDTLMDAMNMSDERAAYLPGEKPWYFGWSNCDSYVQSELRKHYSRPYFLPTDSETVFMDWIFMGGTGLGAPIHLDMVSRPSWQAQITGTKTWTVAPVPECESVCQLMNVTLEPGDIFVIDTNHWYHATQVHPGPLSIVIGSEFD